MERSPQIHLSSPIHQYLLRHNPRREETPYLATRPQTEVSKQFTVDANAPSVGSHDETFVPRQTLSSVAVAGREDASTAGISDGSGLGELVDGSHFQGTVPSIIANGLVM